MMHNHTTDCKNCNGFALLVARVITAVVFFHAGYIKWALWSAPMEGMGQGMWWLMKALAVAEPVLAVALLLGLFTRWVSVAFSAIMVGAIVVLQFVMNVGFVTQQGAGWNFPLVVLATCVLLATFGGGAWSLDAMRKK